MAKSSIITNIFFFPEGYFEQQTFFQIHSSEYRPNFSPSLNEIHWSKMLFLIEKKLFSLVYMWNRDL